MDRWFVFRCLLYLSALVAVAAGIGVYFYSRPGELEASIQNHLVARGDVSESARVTVLKRLQLFDAASHRLDYVTVCIEDDSTYFLAHMRRLAQHPRDSGGNWTTIVKAWRSYDAWPSAAQIEEFETDNRDALRRRVVQGWLPRPPSRIDFRTERVEIRVSEAVQDFDPNAGIDAARFAAIVVHDQGVADRAHLGQFTLAPFHKPRWFPAAAGLEAVRSLSASLETRIKQGQVKGQEASAERDLETLRTVADRLEVLDAHGLRFYFLARDRE